MKYINMRLAAMATALAFVLAAGATVTEIDGIRYDVSGSGTSARAKVQPPAAGKTYEGDIVLPETVEYNSRSYKVTEIVKEAFLDQTGLTSVVVPSTVTSIGLNCFMGCTGLKTAEINADAYSMPNSVFEGCVALEKVTVPNVKSYAMRVFFGCSSLTDVTLSDQLTMLGAFVFAECQSLETLELPASVSTLGVNCFQNCTSLTSLTVGKLYSINDFTFDGCTALASFRIPENCTSVGKSSFAGCASLESMVFPEKITAVKDNAFAGCTGLKFIEMKGAEPFSNMSAAAFDDTFYESGTLYVPDGAVEAFTADDVAEGWKKFSRIKAISDFEPEETWTLVGDALFTEPWIGSIFDVSGYSRTWTVTVYESDLRPGYFKIINPYLGGNCPFFAPSETEGNDIFINAVDPEGVYVETQDLGFTPSSKVGPTFYISSTTGRHIENGIATLEEEKAEGNTGTYMEKIITMPANKLLWMIPGYGDSDFYWCKTDLVIKLPGAKNYEVEVFTESKCLKGGESTRIGFTKSDDVASIRYGVFPGVVQTAPELTASVAGTGLAPEGLLASFTAPADMVGRVTLYAVGLDEEGRARIASTCLLDIISDTAFGPWKSLGVTEYEDVIMLAVYNEMSPAYDVEVQESKTIPGLYRLVDAYSQSGYWDKYGHGNLHNHAERHYVYINASDSEAVYIMPSPIGLAANDGQIYLTSPAHIMLSQDVDKDVIAAAGYFGRMDNYVITIPDNAIYGSEPGYNSGAFYPVSGYDFRVKIPKLDNVSDMADDIVPDNEGATVYYNMQGVRVDAPVPGTVMIKVQGDKATKVIAR